MLTMRNASPRAAGGAPGAGAADAYAPAPFPSAGSDRESFAHDAQAFSAQASTAPLAAKSAPRAEPRAIAARGLSGVGAGAGAGAGASASATSNRPNSQGKAAGSAPRREKRSTKSKCSPGLRSGKWTPEEEAFTNRLIHYFKRGLLDIEDGTSLRWYLAKRLNCEAMRVTKKLKGNSSIGKQIFRALEGSPENRMAILHAKDELALLEQQFLESLSTLGQPSEPRAARPPPSGIKLIGPDGESLQDDANLLLHFFVGAHDAVETAPAAARPRGPKKAASPGGVDLNVQFKLDKKRPFASLSHVPAASERPDATVPSPSKRRSVKIEDLMD